MLARSAESRISRTRWLQAQQYERAFWRRRAVGLEDETGGQLDWYDWKADQLEARLAAVPNPRPRTGRLLEIGSGPIGILSSLEWGERYAIDPLELFYRQTPSLTKLRRPGSTYLAGTGERLPFRNASFSLVIIDNVIDHTYAPAKILQEISRVLEASGYLYLAVNVHTRWGALFHTLLAALQIDKGHPYTFTSRTLRRLLARHRFTILSEEIEDYRQVKRRNRRSPGFKGWIKGYCGLSEFEHIVLCSRNAPSFNT